MQGRAEEALDRLREARADPDPALTPLELARTSAGSSVPAIAPPLAELADQYTVARYGDRPVDASAVDAAWASVAVLERTLDEQQSARERWRRKLDLECAHPSPRLNTRTPDRGSAGGPDQPRQG